MSHTRRITGWVFAGELNPTSVGCGLRFAIAYFSFVFVLPASSVYKSVRRISLVFFLPVKINRPTVMNYLSVGSAKSKIDRSVINIARSPTKFLFLSSPRFGQSYLRANAVCSQDGCILFVFVFFFFHSIKKNRRKLQIVLLKIFCLSNLPVVFRENLR